VLGKRRLGPHSEEACVTHGDGVLGVPFLLLAEAVFP
jgi:hypothetical protein